MAQNRRTIFRRSGAVTGANAVGDASPDQQVIQLGSKAEAWFLLAVRFKRSAGSAANYQLRVRTTAGGASGDINEIYTGTSTAVATATNDVADQPIPFDTDSNGRVYFKSGFDGSSTDNAYDYILWFEKAVGS